MTSAPNALSASIFSFDCLSVVVKMQRYPLMTAAMARPIPVLPDVPSMMVPPGASSPSRSASSIIRSAMRSFSEFPGLKVSSLARTVASVTPRVIALMRTSGVLPIVSRMLLEMPRTASTRERLRSLAAGPWTCGLLWSLGAGVFGTP